MLAAFAHAPELTSHIILHSNRIGIHVANLVIDLEQDLLALIEGHITTFDQTSAVSDDGVLRIHLRSLKSGEAHPETFMPVLCKKDCDNSVDRDQVKLKIADDLVGLSLGPSHVVIWNWSTGDVLAV